MSIQWINVKKNKRTHYHQVISIGWMVFDWIVEDTNRQVVAVAENLPLLTSLVTDSKFLEPEKVELASFEGVGQESLHGAANSDCYELIKFG